MIPLCMWQFFPKLHVWCCSKSRSCMKIHEWMFFSLSLTFHFISEHVIFISYPPWSWYVYCVGNVLFHLLAWLHLTSLGQRTVLCGMMYSMRVILVGRLASLADTIWKTLKWIRWFQTFIRYWPKFWLTLNCTVSSCLKYFVNYSSERI